MTTSIRAALLGVSMGESKFDTITREGLERRITEALNANDGRLADELLDVYPTGRPRNIWAGEQIAEVCQPVKKVIEEGQ